MDEEENLPTFKVGDTAVGKTCILNSYLQEDELTNSENITPTIGVDFSIKTFTFSDDSKVKIQIWDTAGQERYKSIMSAQYRKAVGALLVFDLTKESSFDSIQIWLEDLKHGAEDDIVIGLIGNKLDIIEENPHSRQVTKENAQNFANENDLFYIETSAFKYKNIDNCFEKLIKEVFKIQGHKIPPKKETIKLESVKEVKNQENVKNTEKKPKKRCC